MADETVARIEKAIDGAARLLEKMRETAPAAIGDLADVLARSIRRGGRVYICGNGGSAAGAQHIACELVGRLRPGDDPPALPGMALTTDTSVLTAVANDAGFDDVFARQVEALVREGDVVVGLSTSGRSENVVRALEAARRRGAVTVGMTGAGGGMLGEVSDHLLAVPSDDTPRIQEAQVILGHLLCEEVEHRLEDG
jgi:D-sedoheptulose 7-phosphate isomerase